MTEQENIAKILLEEPRWRIISHIKPDGDTLGSASALCQAGLKLGKDVAWSGADVLPPLYLFLPCTDRYEQLKEIPDDGRCVIYVDVSTLDRGLPGAVPSINIDHHKDNCSFATRGNWVMPHSAAVGEMMYELLGLLGCGIDVPMAEALFVSIVTDCGWFRFSNVTANTLRVGAALAELGVVPSRIDDLLDHNDTLAKVRLWGCCLRRAKRIGPSAVMSWVTQDDFRECQALESDTEGLVNRLTAIAGADLTVLVSEVPGCLRCSVRARGDKSAQEFASKFNGGGHRYASGCRVYLPLEEGLAALERELLSV